MVSCSSWAYYQVWGWAVLCGMASGAGKLNFKDMRVTSAFDELRQFQVWVTALNFCLYLLLTPFPNKGTYVSAGISLLYWILLPGVALLSVRRFWAFLYLPPSGVLRRLPQVLWRRCKPFSHTSEMFEVHLCIFGAARRTFLRKGGFLWSVNRISIFPNWDIFCCRFWRLNQPHYHPISIIRCFFGIP